MVMSVTMGLCVIVLGERGLGATRGGLSRVKERSPRLSPDSTDSTRNKSMNVCFQYKTNPK